MSSGMSSPGYLILAHFLSSPVSGPLSTWLMELLSLFINYGFPSQANQVVLIFKYLSAFSTYVKTKLCKPANAKVILVKFGLEIKLLIIFGFYSQVYKLLIVQDAAGKSFLIFLLCSHGIVFLVTSCSCSIGCLIASCKI